MDFPSLQYSIPFLLVLLLLPLLYLFLFHRRTKSTTQHSLLGLLPQFLKNLHRYLEWATEVLAGEPTLTVVFRSPGKVSEVMTADPGNIEHVLKTNFANYPKGEATRSVFLDFFGNGFLTSDGELWRSQRKIASLEFSTRSLRNFVVNTVQFEIEHRLLPLLGRAAAEEDGVVDLQDVLERFAFDNICRVAFGVDPAALAADDHRQDAWEVPPGFMEAFDEAQKSLTARFLEPLAISWQIKRFLNIGSERRLRQSTKIVHDFASTIVRSRMEVPQTTTQHDDLLSRFISAVGPEDCTVEFLRDVVVGFMLAGRDTTSSSLTWFFWILSSRPDVRANILNEIRSIRSSVGSNRPKGTCFSFDQLKEMHYLHAAITESLRLYPSVPVDSVSCEEDDMLPDGTFVGKGWFVSYFTYSMGRMEKVWGKDCCEYKPERWLEKGVFRPESPYKFAVFNAGPRMCLGKEMAYIQMKSIVASVMERFEVVEVARSGHGGSTPPGYVLSLTLRMKGGLPVRVRENRG